MPDWAVPRCHPCTSLSSDRHVGVSVSCRHSSASSARTELRTCSLRLLTPGGASLVPAALPLARRFAPGAAGSQLQPGPHMLGAGGRDGQPNRPAISLCPWLTFSAVSCAFSATFESWPRWVTGVPPPSLSRCFPSRRHEGWDANARGPGRRGSQTWPRAPCSLSPWGFLLWSLWSPSEDAGSPAGPPDHRVRGGETIAVTKTREQG